MKYKYINIIFLVLLVFVILDNVYASENVRVVDGHADADNHQQQHTESVVVNSVVNDESTDQQQQQQQQQQIKKSSKIHPPISPKVKYEVVVGRADQMEQQIQQQQLQQQDGGVAVTTSVVVPMTLANGTKYKCYIPRPAGDPNESDHDQWSPIPSPSVFADSLSSLAKSQCILYKTGGWWSYEYCHGKAVRQIHIDPAQNKVTAEFVLGTAPNAASSSSSSSSSTSSTADSTTTVSNNNNNNNNNHHNNAHGKIRGLDPSFMNSYNQGSQTSLPEKSSLPYYSELYDDGTPCDISPGSRYYCNNDPNKHFNYIQEMSEPFTCYYIFKVYTNLMCIHPLFKPKHDTILDITCIKDS
ncbi:OS-9-related protein [Heterostelium album PN500]|uniref:OS-9-related protein n=1 Tax=Heterostelium pallidum (strain ATCC 26659 / Pp 5 / PN500) TaxID=670386 RepID=D3AZD4_HETP5|nr:OS-9-related protein [Heterostelium album PN500]EFA85517.1 OS-9-related protein [Heterostelium album PN500]|eukprot:XP_020437625.1 OS-9-related protein [Heterostelium album PN500]